jgi:predicted lipid-binding transport protein (Tim44 family)
MADRYNPFYNYTSNITPYKDMASPSIYSNAMPVQNYQYGKAAITNTPVSQGIVSGTSTEQTANNGGITGAQLGAGLMFADSLFGYGGSLNTEDIYVDREEKIDSDNPYLSGTTFSRNMAASDEKTAKGKAKGAALGSMATGAGLGMVLGGPMGAAAGAIGGGLLGLIGIGSASRKAREARKDALNYRTKNLSTYNNAVKSFHEREAAEQRSSMYDTSGFNSRLMSLI